MLHFFKQSFKIYIWALIPSFKEILYCYNFLWSSRNQNLHFFGTLKQMHTKQICLYTDIRTLYVYKGIYSYFYSNICVCCPQRSFALWLNPGESINPFPIHPIQWKCANPWLSWKPFSISVKTHKSWMKNKFDADYYNHYVQGMKGEQKNSRLIWSSSGCKCFGPTPPLTTPQWPNPNWPFLWSGWKIQR